MLATDLIGADVYDAAGKRVGRVHDLSFEMSGGDGVPVRLRLTGIDVGDAVAVGHRLGFGTSDMAGPWPLSAIFTRRRARSRRHLPWGEVARTEDGRVMLRRRDEQLQADSGRRR
jgi:uncharacterized protein YrrD